MILFIYYLFWTVLNLRCCEGFLQLQLTAATLQMRSAGFSLQWLLLLQNMGYRAPGFQQLWHKGSTVVAPRLQSTGSIVVAHRFNSRAHRHCCSTACGIFLNQRLNPSFLNWQADSLPLSHQGNPDSMFCLKVSIQLSPKKPVCRSKSNSQNQTWKNRLVQNWERSSSRLYIVTLLV